MKLVIAVLALLCIGAHGHGMPTVTVEKTHEGVKVPEITLKLPAVTVPVPKMQIPTINMPDIKMPKISMPVKSLSLQVPTINMPSVNMTNLASMIPKPDLSGLQALMAAKPTVSVTNMPDAVELVVALLSKGSSDVSAIMGLINALSTKPNISMPTMAFNIPKVNMPNISMPDINLPDINLPQMPSIDLNTIINIVTALRGKQDPVDIATQVVGVINKLMNAKPQLALNLNIPKPVFRDFNFSTPQIDLSGLAAAASKMKPLPQIDLSGLAAMALSKPINLALPDITALTNLALNKQHVNMTVPCIEALVNMATMMASKMPSNITLLPEVTAMLSNVKLPSMDLSAVTSMLSKPNIDLSGLTAMLQKPNVTMPDVKAILSAALAQHNANVQTFTSAAAGVIAALAAKPNVQMPDLSGLFSKASFNITVPSFTMPSFSMPEISMPDMSGVVSALLAKSTNDMAALQKVVTALTTKPDLTMPSVKVDLSGLQALMAGKPTTNMTMPAPQMPSMSLSPDAIMSMLNKAGLREVSSVTKPNGQVVIDMEQSSAPAQQPAKQGAATVEKQLQGKQMQDKP